MSEIVKDFWAGMPWGMYLMLVLVFLFIVASWIAPPLAVISKSALQGAALILGSTWLFYISTHITEIVSSGAKIRATYGNASIEIGRHKKQQLDEEVKNEITEEIVDENNELEELT